MEYNSPQPNWFKRNWKWFIPAVVLALILMCVSCAALLMTTVVGAIKSSDVYKQAVTDAQVNPEVIAALGEPVEPGFLVSGSVETSGQAGQADLSIPLSGPQASGTLYVSAVKEAGEWQFNRLEVVVEDSGERIDLLGPR
mgnify:FL=1